MLIASYCIITFAIFVSIFVDPIRHKLMVNQQGNKTIPVSSKHRDKQCFYHVLREHNVHNDQSIFEERVSNKRDYFHYVRFKKSGKYYFYFGCLDISRQVVDNTASKITYEVFGK